MKIKYSYSLIVEYYNCIVLVIFISILMSTEFLSFGNPDRILSSVNEIFLFFMCAVCQNFSKIDIILNNSLFSLFILCCI